MKTINCKIALIIAIFFSGFTSVLQAQTYPFEVPKLPYAYNALEPAIDAATMEIHYSKHHAAYVKNLNAALKGKRAFLLTNLSVWRMLCQHQRSLGLCLLQS